MALFDGSMVVNGTAFSWGSMKFIFLDDTLEFICEATFSEKRNRAFGWGLNKSQAPMKQSAGKYEPDVLKIKGFTGGVQAMRHYLAQRAIDGRSYGNVIFPALIQLVDANEIPIDIRFEGCSWSSNNDSRTEGGELFQDEIEFKFTKLWRNGLSLFDSSEEL